MRTKITILLLFFPICLLCFTGCYGTSAEFQRIRDLIKNGNGVNYERDVEFGLGSISLSLIQGIVSISDSEDEAKDILENISSVQVGIYKPEGYSKGGMKNFRKIISRMNENGWTCIIRNTKKNDAALIFIKDIDSDRFEDIFIISQNSKELALVEVHGNLKRILARAIKDRDINISMVKD